jgi:succinoglycan biosynthesis protein ExoM
MPVSPQSHPLDKADKGRVLIAVPTAGQRPRLIHLMDRLSAIAVSNSDYPFTVVIIDNSVAADPSLAEQCSQRGLEYARAYPAGYATARNRALDLGAAYDYLVFIDDDENPLFNWPVPLLQAISLHHADVAFGPVRSMIDGKPPRWLSNAQMLRRTSHYPPGIFLGRDVYSGNTALRMSCINKYKLRFSQQFDLSGGEDTDLFRRLRALGGIICWVPDALVDEIVDPSRLLFRDYLHRRMSSGELSWRLISLDNPMSARATFIFRRACRFVLGIARMAAGVITFSRPRIAYGLGEMALGVGTLRAFYSHNAFVRK